MGACEYTQYSLQKDFPAGTRRSCQTLLETSCNRQDSGRLCPVQNWELQMTILTMALSPTSDRLQLLCSVPNLSESGRPWMILHLVPQEHAVCWRARGSFRLPVLLNCAWAQQVAEPCSVLRSLPKSLPVAITSTSLQAAGSCWCLSSWRGSICANTLRKAPLGLSVLAPRTPTQARKAMQEPDKQSPTLPN